MYFFIYPLQIEYRYEWLEILRAYVQPIQLRVFEGYNNDVGVSIASVKAPALM